MINISSGGTMPEWTEEKIQELDEVLKRLSKDKTMITVYSKNNCPFCEQAKHYLKTNGFVFEELKIDENPDAREFLIGEGHRTAPQLYVGKELLVAGGYQGLAKMSPDQIQERLGELNVSNK